MRRLKDGGQRPYGPRREEGGSDQTDEGQNHPQHGEGDLWRRCIPVMIVVAHARIISQQTIAQLLLGLTRGHDSCRIASSRWEDVEDEWENRIAGEGSLTAGAGSI